MQVLGNANGNGQSQDEREAIEMLSRFFSYAAQNPQTYPQMRAHMLQEDMLDPEDLPDQMTPQQLEAAAGMFEQMRTNGMGVGDLLASAGRGGDTMMAHINPNEAELLKAVGGAGSINPITGQPEYLKKFFKSVVKPLVGATIGFMVAGPAGAAIGAGYGYSMDQQANIAKQQMAAQQQQTDAILQAQQEEAERARQAEIRRQQNISEGQGIISDMFSQFDNNFYDQRAADYSAFARPQLDQQYNQSMQGLVRSLARTGNLNSSMRGQAMADLQEQYNRGLLTIADQGNRYAGDARNAIEAARGNLISQNASLADPGTIRSLAQSQVSSLSSSPSYSPLQNLISALSKSSPGGVNAAMTTNKPREQASVDLFASAPPVATGRTVS